MPDEPAPAAEPVARDMPFRAVALSVIVGTATVAALQFAQPVVVPLLLALLFAYALEPAVALLVRIRVPRTVAAVLVFGLVLAGINATGRMAVNRVNGFLADLPAI